LAAHVVRYVPGESGRRGRICLPINFLLVEALLCPKG